MMQSATASDGFQAAVAIVLHAVEVAARRGDGAGMPKLVERLDALTVGPPLATSGGPQGLIDVVYVSMVRSISAALVEGSRRKLIKRLRETRPGPFHEDAWAGLDSSVSSTRMEQIRRERDAAADRAVRATEHYRQTGRTQHLRDAVTILEGCLELEVRVTGSRLTPANCDAEFERLGVALQRSMPSWGWVFFSRVVTQEAESEVVMSGIAVGKTLRRRFNSWFEGPWKVLEPSDSPVCRTAPFVGPYQACFKEFLEDWRRVRAAEEAAKAESDRRLQEWQATRRREAEDRSREASPAADDGAARSGSDGRSDASSEQVSGDCHPNGYVLVRSDKGLVYVHPDMAAAMNAEYAHRARQDAWAIEQELARLELAERVGKPYEPRYLDIRKADISGQTRTEADTSNTSA